MKLDDVIIETDSEGNCTDEEDSEKKKEEERKLQNEGKNEEANEEQITIQKQMKIEAIKAMENAIRIISA